MLAGSNPIQNLLTLPSRMSGQFELLEGRHRPEWFACSDPAGKPLGSGGGTANLLAEAWHATGSGSSFKEWLLGNPKLVLHAGGQSRRLPPYAAVGKLLMPLPVLRWARGQRLDQTLLDLQLSDYHRVLGHAGNKFPLMITSGDVLLHFARELPPFPQVDVLGLGMWVPAETASAFGVFFSPRHQPTQLAFFLQKPSPERIAELGRDYLFLVDTGMWLLGERAVRLLMERCGWNSEQQKFTDGSATPYEFYAQFGLALGRMPALVDPELNQLSCAVIPLPEAHFHHFGTCEQMLESVAALQNLVVDPSHLGSTGARHRPDQVTLNSRFNAALRREGNERFWVENSVVPGSWQLASDHVLTGIPENNWSLRLEPGVCLDFAPVSENDFCLRVYGFKDAFRGTLRDGTTRWLGRTVAEWFTRRGLNPEECGILPDIDIQFAPLFPVLSLEQIKPDFIQWMTERTPLSNFKLSELWRKSRRLSAADLVEQTNLLRLYRQRAALRAGCLKPLWEHFRSSILFRLDLESTAAAYASTAEPLPDLSLEPHDPPMHRVHDQMFRSAVLRHRQNPDWSNFEAGAFAQLRETIAREARLTPVLPRPNVLEDQIVWARSPVRFDLAGGWTDTPPYCLEHGGRVLNLAAELNGQPPIQVFAKLSEEPAFVLRSIDLGVEERVRTYAELDAFNRPDNPFSLAKAALALAGFLPAFHANGGCPSLEAQLKDFGGGIELSLLCAVPKGSGLGTSSILAATLLAALGDLCGLGWDRNSLFTRTLALEQMLTTGGGWQDQAGAIYCGIKLIETAPGLEQKPTLHWLPGYLFEHDYANRCVLLYYTGLTRLAKNILGEIVRGIFLNSPAHLEIIGDIGDNTKNASAALQQCDYDALTQAMRRSWLLNQRLDSGTNPPAVQAILESIQDYLAAAKLLGAGGGGYLLLFARDESAAAKLKHVLTESPPNKRARFVNFNLSETGLQVTRS